MAEQRDEPKSPRDGRPAERPAAADAKVRFARAMARAEFGRFYWSTELQQALHKAMKRKPKR